jgi:ornithine--oxo-acid transaminase
MCDEIQSGLGRTGKLFAFEWDGIRPDAVIIGKALSGGFYPVSAFLTSDEVMGVFHPGDHGSTFGGNPLGMAVAREALKVLTEERLIENSAELGPWFLEQLASIDTRSVVEARGRGLWVGLVLSTKGRPYCEALMGEGVLCKETHENVIRFAPPLCVTREELEWALERVHKVFHEIDG